jgi:serine/threonine protein kinase
VAEVGSTANSYQILAKLATGGMAEIFLARGEAVAGVERYCVLKRILRDRASDVHFVRMFLDEARLAAQLQHPNIAQVYDIGKLGDSYFFTMEYVHGETVRALLHRAQGLRRKLPISCVLTIAAGTAAGLHHAHTRLGRDGRALGIVHRDVSPSNLMVSYEGGVKVVDFGVAKAADRTHETKSGTVKGKISYLSPEQCKGKQVDRRSDLFSLGICFWEMLTTERLFKRTSDFENMNAIVTEATPPPSSRRPDVPPEIDQLVLRLLAKKAEERFQTADELVEAIEEVAVKTGSVLSGSGLGRFVRELFGQRPEPWLELETQREHGEAVTVTSEPIPRELGIPAADEIDRQLASVVNLSSPPSITESLDSAPLDISTVRVGKPGSLALPLAAPPQTQPRIDPLAVVASGSPPARTTGPSAFVPPPQASPGAPAPSLSSSDVHTQSLPALEAPPTGPDAYTPSSGQLLPPAPVAVSHAVPRSGPMATPAGPEDMVRASGSYSTPEGMVRASGSYSTPEAMVRSYGTPQRRRAVWPLYAAIIGGAALFGSIAVVIMMQTGAGAIRVDAVSVSKASAPVVRSIDPLPVPPAASPTGDPSTAPGATGPGIADPAAIEPGAPERSAGSASAAGPRGAGEALHGAGDAGDHRSSARPGNPPRSDTVSPTVRKFQPSRATSGSPKSPEFSAGAPSRNADPPAASQPPGGRGSNDEISRAFAEAHYDKVVALCGAGPVSAEHAPICFIAACHAGDEPSARRLITAVPVGRREQLTTNCKQLGVDITMAKKPDRTPAQPVTRPASECEADPMACQH